MPWISPFWDAAVSVAYLVLLCWSWRKLSLEGLQRQKGWRNVCGAIAVTFATTSALLFVTTQVYATRIGYFPALTRSLAGFFVGCWVLSILSFSLAIVSKGWRRMSAAVLSAVVVVLWSAILMVGSTF